MAELHYEHLTRGQCLQVLQAAHVTRAGFQDARGPYVTPMAFCLSQGEEGPLVYLWLQEGGRKAGCLRFSEQICLEFEEPGCGYVDVVLAEGQARPEAWERGAGLVVSLRPESLTGRRFFLPQEADTPAPPVV